MIGPHWTKERVFHDGDAFFAGLLAAIAQARVRINFEVYIFEHDALGDRVVNALIAAAQRGVQVRLLVDGVGSQFWRYHYLKKIRQAGIKARVYHPLPWALLSFPLRFTRVFQLFSHINRRNHRKVCTIDGKEAWLGSMNVSHHHLREFREESAWRDTGVYIAGKELRHLEHAFRIAWARAWYLGPWKGRLFARWRRPKPRLVLLNDTARTRHRHAHELVERCALAQTRIWLTNAYFIPPRPIARALTLAAQRGMDVQLLLPARSDIRIAQWAGSAYYGQLLKAGVRIFEYQPSTLHAKTMLIDDWASVGTSNLDVRSFRHDFEVVIVLTRDASTESLASQFKKDIERAEEISFEQWLARPLLKRLAERIALLLRYWL